MEKIDIIVPKGIRYLGQWTGNGCYRLENYPFPHILDKVLTGCGFTEFCLTNSQNLILCSPRKMLLENKEDQHKGEIYYARNDIYGSIDYDISLENIDLERRARRGVVRFKSSIQIQKEEEEKKRLDELKKQRILQFKADLLNYYYSNPLKPRKIIVTYDSFKHVKEALEEIGVMDKFQVVVDEFQSILVDVKFKTDTELALMSQLKGLSKVCFVSATPMLDKYLERLEDFKDLPYYRLDWKKEDLSRIISPNLSVRATESVFSDAVKVINIYKEGKFEKSSTINSSTGLIEEVVSNEAVLYVNSVKTICMLIVKCELTLDNTNILCARTDENGEKIRKAFNDSLKKQKLPRYKKETKVIGDIPKKDEPHKMFTICTRTVYLGADFYSKCARSFIFSDANIESLTVDISMDLPQILGRQRLVENPWKNCAELYIKSSILSLNKDDFDKEIAKKTKKTENLLKVYDSADQELRYDLAEKYLDGTIVTLYCHDYVAVNKHTSASLIPTFNKLMLVADQRAFDIQQIDYRDRVSVFNTLSSKGFVVAQVEKELGEFNNISYYHDKMKYICEAGKVMEKNKFNLLLNSIPISFKNYYSVLGPDRCSAAKFQKGEMEKVYQVMVSNQEINIRSEIYATFNVGDRMTKADIKQILGKIYNTLGYKKTARATDLDEYFVTKPIMLSNPDTKKRDNGLELISKK